MLCWLLGYSSTVSISAWRDGCNGLEAAGVPNLATCSITELGFVRVLAQTPEFGFNVAGARSLLLELKVGSIPKFTFLRDGQDIATLPAWVATGRQTTDGHLLELAKAN